MQNLESQKNTGKQVYLRLSSLLFAIFYIKSALPFVFIVLNI